MLHSSDAPSGIRRPLGMLLVVMTLTSTSLAQLSLDASGEQMRMDVAQSTITPHPDQADTYNVVLVTLNDNGNHPNPGFRQWWHAEISGFEGDRDTKLLVTVGPVGYREVVLPVWSLDGEDYERIPETPISVERRGSEEFLHRFTVVVPAGVRSVRLSKYFPYTVTQKLHWIASIQDDPRVRVNISGASRQGRAIIRLDITDPATPPTHKQRVWIHSMVHPGETTSMFLLEGLVGFLLSGTPEAETLLRGTIFNLYPMVNPDGVVAGNYRTSLNNTNLEDEWEAPYQSSEPEIHGLQRDLFEFMGTVENPAPNPIRILLNLHAAGGNYPFHFVHQPLWTKPGDLGVNQEVYELEKRWVATFRARSEFVRRGYSIPSRLRRGNTRPFVEAALFDLYSSRPEWTSGDNPQPPVMGITFEGTYRLGPTGAWAVPDDYRQTGHEMALAISDFLGLTPEGLAPAPNDEPATPPDEPDDDDTPTTGTMPLGRPIPPSADGY